MAGASHTAHLDADNGGSNTFPRLASVPPHPLHPLHPYLLMKGLMRSPVMGAMDEGMGSGVDSQ